MYWYLELIDLILIYLKHNIHTNAGCFYSRKETVEKKRRKKKDHSSIECGCTSFLVRWETMAVDRES